MYVPRSQQPPGSRTFLPLAKECSIPLPPHKLLALITTTLNLTLKLTPSKAAKQNTALTPTEIQGMTMIRNLAQSGRIRPRKFPGLH
ncbi:uncharacterized protein RAG0_05978 [Rhynchosporium agropyri]|uniref:Uncharacterized protein n=1 Tax=Rhynchosporium agropyri TaxID=914238 RepID=A0A1E1KFG7_9HELO|nr:uncharacterized protein RAG0_05978 [Rhynchosporium agropyri]